MEFIKKHLHLIIGIFSLIFVFFVYLIKNDENPRKNNDDDDDEIISKNNNSDKLTKIVKKNKELKEKLNGKSISKSDKKSDRPTNDTREETERATKEGNQPDDDEQPSIVESSNKSDE